MEAQFCDVMCATTRGIASNKARSGAKDSFDIAHSVFAKPWALKYGADNLVATVKAVCRLPLGRSMNRASASQVLDTCTVNGHSQLQIMRMYGRHTDKLLMA